MSVVRHWFTRLLEKNRKTLFYEAHNDPMSTIGNRMR